MSLVAWWPLNGNLKNYAHVGGSLIATDTSVNTITVDGKIGKTYTNTSNTAGTLLSEETFNLGPNQSMFCWIYMTSVYNSSNLNAIMGQHRYSYNGGKGMNMGLTVRYASATSGYLSVNTATSTGRTYNEYYGKTLLTTGKWYHVGYTYDGSNIRLYVNGILDATYAFTGQVFASDYFGAFMWSLSGSSLGTREAHPNYIPKGKINDIRIYNHTLSNKEVYNLAKGLILHYGFESSTTFGFDNSGFGYNGTISNVSSTSTTSGRGISSAVFNGSSSYIDTPFLKSDILSSNWTIMFWLYSKDNNASGNVNRAVYFGDYGLTDGTKFNIEKTAAGALRVWCNGGSNDLNTALTIPYQTWAHIAITYMPGTLKVYLNGELKDTKTVTISSTKSSGGFRLGRDSRTGDTAFNGNMANLKIFTTTLSLEDIKAESKRVKGIDRNGSSYVAAVYELDVDRSCVSKSSVQRINYLTEVIQMEDGSYWLQVSHHNNKGGTNLFSSTDAFETEFIYHNDECWAAFNLIKSHGFYNNKYEFMAFEQLGTGNNFAIRRWSQTVNPFTATYATAKKDSGNFTAISNIPSMNGGMYKMDSTNTYFCICNATSGNWYGAFGASSKHGNGIPTFNNSTTAGVLDLFVRISPTDALRYKEFKGGVVSTFNLIEN